MALSKGQNLNELIGDHNAVCRSLVSRDPAAAQDAMRSHLRRALGHAVSLADEHPDWFSD
jgi:DNA-binding GntR family transcriptional regulator